MLIIGMIIIGIIIFEPFRFEPPTPVVAAGDSKIPTTQGSYCWGGLITAKCVDKVYTGPLDMAKVHKPTVVSSKVKIKIDFRKNPIDGTMKVEQWIDKDNQVNVEVKNGYIVIPEEKGIYIYYIVAEWKKGRGNYAFSVKVK